MREFFNRLFSQASETAADLPPSKKVAIAILSLVVMAGVLGIAYFAGKPDYHILFSGLSASDSASVTEALNKRNVDYKLAQGGAAILVPSNNALRLRLELATEGLPAGSSVGFEIFDKSTFGMTEFVQKINLKRALQGELERTINKFTEVDSSRIHIASPQKKLFTKESDPTTASVVLKMVGSRRLGKEQVTGIVHLVASSVENLRPENVTVVDVNGHVLSGGEPDDEIARLSSTQLEYRTTVERSMEKRLTSMLESVVGVGKVVTRVSTQLDFKRVERTEKKFDPESQVARSEQRAERSSSGAQAAMGVPGVQSNIPGREGSQVSAGKPAETKDNQETVNYEINETVSHITDPVGSITKMSVAVVVDGKYETTQTEGEEGATKEYVARTTEELAQLENLIRTAAGVDTARGDVVTVQSAPFDTTGFDSTLAMADSVGASDLYSTIARYAGTLVLVALLFLFIIRPLMTWITSSSDEMDRLQTFPQTVEQLENQFGAGHSTEEGASFRDRVKEMIENDPKVMAELLREWLRARR